MKIEIKIDPLCEEDKIILITKSVSEEINEIVEKLSQSTQQIDTLQHQTLSDIENIGTSFMNEQEARKGLETIVDQLIGNMR